MVERWLPWRVFSSGSIGGVVWFSHCFARWVLWLASSRGGAGFCSTQRPKSLQNLCLIGLSAAQPRFRLEPLTSGL